MKIIFLDIDGVLNSERFIVDHHKEYNDPTYMIDQYTVTLLRDMLDKHDDCKLVITSSWRYGNVNKTVKFLNEHGLGRLTKFIVGVTPRSTNGGRGDEIKWFMDNLNTDKIGDFVDTLEEKYKDVDIQEVSEKFQSYADAIKQSDFKETAKQLAHVIHNEKKREEKEKKEG